MTMPGSLLDDIVDCWVDDDEDRRNKESPDVRATAQPPEYNSDL